MNPIGNTPRRCCEYPDEFDAPPQPGEVCALRPAHDSLSSHLGQAIAGARPSEEELGVENFIPQDAGGVGGMSVEGHDVPKDRLNPDPFNPDPWTGEPRNSKTDDNSWAFEPEVFQLIHSVFPGWQTNHGQAVQAARWVDVVYLHFRQGLSTGAAAEVMDVTEQTVHSIVRNMRRVNRGQTAKGDERGRGRGWRKGLGRGATVSRDSERVEVTE